MVPSKKRLIEFLESVDGDFPVPLSSKTDLEGYADKLLREGTFFIEAREGQIVSMVAGYIKNRSTAYVSLVATRREYRRHRLASSLLSAFLARCAEEGKRAVELYTHETNENAIRLYESFGFQRVESERPHDVHFLLEPISLP